VWLYLPDSTSVASSPASADSILPSVSQCRKAARWLWSRGKRAPARFWLTKCKKEFWTRRLFGQRLKPSTASRGVASWIASLRVHHANLSASLAKEPDSPTNEPTASADADPSFTSPASWESVDPPWSSSRMSRLSFAPDTLEDLEKNYLEWVSRSKARSSSVRKTLARVTKESACSFWPTATSGQPDGRNHTSGRQPGSQHHDGFTLADAVKLWLTPHGMAGTDATGKQGAGGEFAKQTTPWPTAVVNPEAPNLNSNTVNGPTSLGEAATLWASPTASEQSNRTTHNSPTQASGEHGMTLAGMAGEFPSPASTWATVDANCGERGNKMTEKQRTRKRGQPKIINHQAHAFPCSLRAPAAGNTSPIPTVRDDSLPFLWTVTLPSGAQCLNVDPTLPRRRLNVKFVEWLMNLPEGWTSLALTDLGDAEMPLLASRQRLRFLFSGIERSIGNPK
jgi:hypothetical protein